MEILFSGVVIDNKAATAISNLQRPGGNYRYYRDALDRLFKGVLHGYDDLLLDDSEAMETLRAIDDLRQDLKDIAGQVAHYDEPRKTIAEIAESVDRTFEGVDVFE